MPPFDLETWLRSVLREAGIRARGTPSKELTALRLPKTRSSRERVPPPPSMRRALAVHHALAPYGQRLRPAPKKSAAITAELQSLLGSDVVAWNDDPNAAGLIPLPASGDQRLFLWIGDPSPNGEYPVVALSDEPSLFLRYASFAHYLDEAFGCRQTKALDAAFGSMADAKRRTKRALAREGIAEVADVEGPLQPSQPKKAALAKKAAPKRAATSPASPAAALGALDALASFGTASVYSAKYRAQASAALAELIPRVAVLRDELLSRLRRTAFPTASVAAAALVHLAAEASEPLLVADVFAAMDARRDVFDQEWKLDPTVLAKAIGKSARACFAQALDRSADAPCGPWLTRRYAPQFLSSDEIAHGVSRAVLAAATPVWGLFVGEVALTDAARKRALESFLPRGYEEAAPDQFRRDDPRQHLEELTYALELKSASKETVARLSRRASELVVSFTNRVGGDDVFGEVVASPTFRRAERAYPGATQPLREAVEAAGPLTEAVRALRSAPRTSVTKADLDRFRGRALTKQQLFLLSRAAHEAAAKNNAALARAVAELVLGYDREHVYAKQALAMVD